MTKSNSKKLDQTGIQLTPPKGLTIKEVNFTQAIGSIFKFVIGAGTFNPALMATATVEFGNLADYSDSEKAWHLVTSGLLSALEQVVQDGGMLNMQNPNIEDKLSTVVDTFCQELLTLNCHLDQDFLTQPHKLLTDSKCEAIVIPALTNLGHSDASAKILYQRFKYYFPFALTKASQQSKIDYSSLFSAIKSEFASAEKTAIKKRLYNQFITRQAYESVFNDIVGLKQIYVPLNAYYHQKHEEGRHTKTVVELHDNLNQWVLNTNSDHDVKVIAGGPGAGKSSFTKIWAAEMVDKLNYPVIYIPLQRFQINDSLTAALANFFSEQPDWSSLSNVLPNEPKLLLIFDGLDEYSMTGQQSDQAASEFVDEVIRTLQQKNTNGGQIKAIITGRDLSIDNNKSKWRCQGQILHLLPYYVDESEHDKFNDPNKLLTQDLRQTWWLQYAKAKNHQQHEFPTVFNQNKLQEVSAEPLLNYLLTLSYLAKRIRFDDNTTIAAIYEDLIFGVFNRDYSNRQHKSTEDMQSAKEFMLILEEVALAISYNGGRLATEKAIQEHIQKVDFNQLFEKLQQKAKSGVTRLLMAFYFRQGEVQDGDNTFEWTHKSFGEYLVARRLLRLLDTLADERQRATQNPGRGLRHHEALEDLVQTTAPIELNDNIRDFIQSILHQNIDKTECDINTLKCYQLFLVDCINNCLESHLNMTQYMPSANFADLCKFEFNAITCIFVLHSQIASISNQISTPKLPDHESLRKLYLRVNAYAHAYIFRNSLNHLALNNQNLDSLDLNSTDFTQSELRESSFNGAMIDSSEFTNCNLSTSDFIYTTLIGASLTECNFQNTYFEEARIEHCNFTNSRLKSSNFKGTVTAANRGLATCQDLHLAHNIPDEWQQYIKKDDAKQS